MTSNSGGTMQANQYSGNGSTGDIGQLTITTIQSGSATATW
jgi:hypothetical protein